MNPSPSLEPISAEPLWRIGRPVMRQGWHDLTAIHWRYPAEVVQALLPDGFTVDTFDGSAWVGLLPFQMDRIRLFGLPPFGRFSTFPETNIRTYIVDTRGRRAVWFCSLDITRLAPTLVARTTYNLPYCWSTMEIATPPTAPDERHYTSQRRWPRAHVGAQAATTIAVRIGERIASDDLTDLDHFLTARWALGSTFARRLLWARVEHPPWPIHAAQLLRCEQTLTTAAGLPEPVGEPYVRWSPGVDVTIERPRLIR